MIKDFTFKDRYDINDLLEEPLSAEEAPETGSGSLPQKLRKLLEAWKTKKEGCREQRCRVL